MVNGWIVARTNRCHCHWYKYPTIKRLEFSEICYFQAIHAENMKCQRIETLPVLKKVICVLV